MDALPKPDLSKYETSYLKMTDGNWHEILLEFVKEQESQFKKWEMLFRVWKHRVGGGAMVEYEPPKLFNTSAKEFAVEAINAAANGNCSFWIQIRFKDGKWNLAPSSEKPIVSQEKIGVAQ